MAHAQYLTYDEYKAYGGALAPAAYPPMELKSRKRIDYLTDSRVQNMQTVPDAVKLCAFALIALEEAVGVEAQATNPAVTSFNTDGYSESYGNALNTDEARRQMNKLIGEYLYGERDDDGVPLLYSGVRGRSCAMIRLPFSTQSSIKPSMRRCTSRP